MLNVDKKDRVVFTLRYSECFIYVNIQSNITPVPRPLSIASYHHSALVFYTYKSKSGSGEWGLFSRTEHHKREEALAVPPQKYTKALNRPPISPASSGRSRRPSRH